MSKICQKSFFSIAIGLVFLFTFTVSAPSSEKKAVEQTSNDTLQNNLTLLFARLIPTATAVLVLQEEDEMEPQPEPTPAPPETQPLPEQPTTLTDEQRDFQQRDFQPREGQQRDFQQRGGPQREGRQQRGGGGGYQQPGQQGEQQPPGARQGGGQGPGGRGPAAPPPPETLVVREPRLVPAERIRFSFRNTSWKDAIEWFADQAALNLQADKMPTGTLNLMDIQYYTPTEGLDILNHYLLVKNYVLIRKVSTLFVLYLPDGIPPNLLEPITADALDSRGKYEICKCVFSLNRTTPDVIQTEIEKFLGPQGDILLMPRSQQIVVTETGGTLRAIRDIIRRIDDPDGVTSGALQVVEVNNLTAEEAVQMMRRLLTIEETDPSLRTVVDTSGKKILLSGRGDMIEKARDVISRINDSFGSNDPAMRGEPKFHTYSVGAADPTAVLAVLQTLLADTPEPRRLSLDARTNGILVYGRPAVHTMVEESIKQMQLNMPQVDSIYLSRMSPLKAVEYVKMFYQTYSPLTSTTQQSGRGGEQRNTSTASTIQAPTVEADTTARRIIVRGTSSQIAEIRVLLAQLGEDGTAKSSNVSTVRAVPLSPAATSLVLEQLQSILPKLDPNIKVVLPAWEAEPEKEKINNTNERNIDEIIDEMLETEPPMTRLRRIVADPILAQVAETPSPQSEVTVTVTPAGFVLSSNDPEALAKLEGVIRMLSDESVLQRTELKTYYLKNSTAAVISSSLQSLMGTSTGGSASGVASVDVPEWQTSETIGMMMASPQGNTIEKTGTVTIAVDERLNALYIQANAVDHKTIEKLLKMLDQPARDDIMNRASPRLIPLFNMRAEEAKSLVDTAFANRMQGSGNNRGGGQQGQGGGNQQQQGRGQQGQAQPFVAPGGEFGGMGGGQMPPGFQQALQAMAGGGQGGRGGNNTPREQDPGMTVGIYPQKNALIITSSEALFLEVQTFVNTIDTEAAQTVTVVATEKLVNVTPTLVRQSLVNLLGADVVKFSTNQTVQGQQFGGGGNFGGMGNLGGGNQFNLTGGGNRQGGGFGGGTIGGGNFGGGNIGGGAFGGGAARPGGTISGGTFGGGTIGGGNFGGGARPGGTATFGGGAGGTFGGGGIGGGAARPGTIGGGR